MGIEEVKEYLRQFGADERVLVLHESSATVALAAAALGCQEQRIAKTLSFMVKDEPTFIVVAGDARIDNGKYKHFFGAKAKMMTSQELEDFTGLHFGGVCPFGIPENVKIYLDESLRRFDYVYPACGTANSAIKVTLQELEKFSGSRNWIDVCKIPE